MATVTAFTDGQPVVKLDGNMVGVIENYVSFAVTSVSAADVVEVLDVGAGTFVSCVWMIVLTAEGATATCDIGDATDPNGYDDSVNMNASAGTITRTLETDAYTVGKYYSSADTIDLTIDNDTDAAIVYMAATAWWPERYSS